MTRSILPVEQRLLTFHHNGLAVPEPSQASLFLAAQGYQRGRTLFDPAQQVNLAMWHHAMEPDFELIWPGDGPSPVDKMLKQQGAQVYHCCFETACHEAALEQLERSGLFVVTVSEATPAPLFDGRDVSFHFIDGFGLIELLSAT